MVHEMRGIMMP